MFRRRRWTLGPLVLVLIGVSAAGQARGAIPPGPRPEVTGEASGLVVEWQAPRPEIILQADGTVRVTMPGYTLLDKPGAPQLPFASALVALPPDAEPALDILSLDETGLPLPGPLALAPEPQGVTARDAADGLVIAKHPLGSDTMSNSRTGTIVGGGLTPASQAPVVTTLRSAPLGLVVSAFHPAPVELQPVGITRGVRLARLVFYPVRPIQGVQGELRWAARVRVAVRYHEAPLWGNAPGAALPAQTHWDASPAALTDPLLAAVRSVVVNPEAALPVSHPAVSAGPALHSAPTLAAPRIAVEVRNPGLTAITYEALSGLGFPLASAEPQYLHLRRALGEARSTIDVPVEWEGDADAAFEPGERLVFYAAPRFSRWTATDMYFLTVEETPGLRVNTRPADPTGLPPGTAWVEETFETNALYTPVCYCGLIPAGRDGDHWTWDDLRRPDRASANYPAYLPALDTTRPATLTLWFIGYTRLAASPDHRINVALNGVDVGRVEWDGAQAVTATLPVPAGVLSENSALNLTLPGLPGVSVEGAWLDAFSLTYARSPSAAYGSSVRFGLAVDSSPGPLTAPYHLYLPLVTRNFGSPHSASAYTVALAAPGPYRAYDITDPDYPVRLTAFTLAGGVVTLGETDSTWADGRVRVVAAESAIAAPERLRRAAPPPPIGGADYLVLAHSDFIPALAPLITLRQSQGLSVGVVDVRAVYDAHDGRPTPEAIRAYLANAYANWNPRPTYVLLVGDGTYDPKHYRANSSATFIPPYLADVDPRAGETAADNRYVTLDGGDALPDMLIGRLPVNTLAEAQTVVDKIVQYETRPFPGGWNSNVVFVADNPDTAGDFAAESAALAAAYIASPFTAWPIYYPSPTTPAESFHQDILSRWNSGAGLILFNGHASDLQWAAERLFHRDDAPALSNGPRLPVVAEMTCFTGSFHVPDYATLDETLLRHPDGGAVAVWGATGLGVATGHTHLANGFLASLYQQGQAGLGAAALAGKLNLAQSGNYPDLLDTYMLFGDPATQADLTLAPWASAQYLPLIQR